MYYLNLAYLITRSAPFIIQLLPICYQYMYADFVSVVGGALCIIMTGLFDCQKVRWVKAIRMLFFFECPRVEILLNHFLRQILL